MCPNHHQEVDDLDPERYPVELLSDMKNRSMEGAGDWTTIQELDRMAGQMIQKLAYLDVAEDAKLEARSAPGPMGISATLSDPLYGGSEDRTALAPTPTSAAGIRLGFPLDITFHKLANSEGRFEVRNVSATPVTNVNIAVPDDIENFQIVGDLPIERLPPGASVGLATLRSFGAGSSRFDVLVTCEIEGGRQVSSDVFVSLD